ncbi:MAG: sulfotransferase family protein [Elusimicrobiota bacterium]|nr:sulfotransferase family protein [Elusimicrobiota bacterium]
MVDMERKFLFNRLTKVASSALMVTLKPKAEDGKKREKYKQKHKRPSKLKKRDVKKVDDLFKFIFVRNPYDRILSAYLHKIGTDDERREKFKKPVPGLFKKYGDNPSFNEFCRYLEDGGLYENKHLAPQVSLMALPKEEFSFIGKFENIEEDFKKVTEQVKNLDVRHMKRGGTYTGASNKRKKYYDAETADRVYRLYREDFESFNYSRDLAK